MGSLSYCLKKLGFSKDEESTIRERVSSLKEEGYSHMEASEQSARDMLDDLKSRREELYAQLSKKPRDLKVSSYNLYEDMDQPERTTPSALDSLQKGIAPASRGPIASQQAGIMREHLGTQAREGLLDADAFRAHAKTMSALPRAEQLAFIDRYEKGQAQPTPALERVAADIKEYNNALAREIQALGTGKLQEFDENYLGRIWQQPTRAATAFSKRPLEGGKGFLKRRTFQYFMQGIDRGLVPITYNPVEMVLLKGAEMNRYIYGQKIIQEMHAAGLTRLVPHGEAPPDGWTRINDKVAFAGSSGTYYAPDEAATLLNNHLSSGLQGNGVYQLIRHSGMLLNSLQLGLSAFHLGFTTVDAMVSRAALGFQQMSRGQFLKGPASLATSVLPTQPFVNLWKGDRLLRAYMGNLADPALNDMVHFLVEGGGRVRMDDFYRNATINSFRQALRRNDLKGAAALALPRLLDTINAPIFEHLVPRQKLGVFFDLARDWLERNPDASKAERRAAAAKLWDSVDNRMGQLVYDNVFWHRTLKDALMISVRSVGWNLGTLRELGGGVADIRDFVPRRNATGGMRRGTDSIYSPRGGWKGMSPRTGYILGLVFVTAVIGALIGAMYGNQPRELKDYFFPKTGGKNPDGTDARYSLPTYIKDVYGYHHDPVGTVVNKLHPLLSLIGQFLTNKDFFGNAITSPRDPLVQRLEDDAKWLIKQIMPFGIRNYQQQSKAQGKDATVGGYLTSPSNFGLTPAPGYITKNDAQLSSSEASRMKDSLIGKFRQEIRDGADPGSIAKRAAASGLLPGEITSLIKQGKRPQGQAKTNRAERPSP
jgi:hypothetical protein